MRNKTSEAVAWFLIVAVIITSAVICVKEKSEAYDKGYKDGYESGYSVGENKGYFDGYAARGELETTRRENEQNSSNHEQSFTEWLEEKQQNDASTNTSSTPAPVPQLRINPAPADTSSNSEILAKYGLTESASQPQSQTVYITDSGSKYHRDGCQYLQKSRIPISLATAKARGYTPCSKCW